MKESKRDDIIVLSTADWDNPFWTNKQHVSMELSKRGHRVLYIESLGLRQPSINKKDLTRIFKRLIKGIKPPRKVRDNIWVWSPISIPFNKFALIRKLNKLLLTSLLYLWSWKLKFNKPILWTYNPLTDRFLNLKKFDYIVYHCVDEIKAQPGMPVEILDAAEKELVQNANITFVTSPTLLNTRKRWSDEVYYFSNVADYEHFSKACDESLSVPVDIGTIKKPILGFIGAISSYKVDFELLIHIADSCPDVSIVLIGDIGEGDPSTNAEKLRMRDNIHILGARPYAVLPAYLKAFDVALLPNNINEYTASMFPMKFFEYLSAGKNVVSVDLASIQEFSDYLKIAQGNDDFVIKIKDVLNGNIVSREDIDRLARQFTYKTRTDKMFDLIDKKKKNI
ncbi:TPA: glycosyltransferase [Raoultella planticola]